MAWFCFLARAFLETCSAFGRLSPSCGSSFLLAVHIQAGRRKCLRRKPKTDPEPRSQG